MNFYPDGGMCVVCVRLHRKCNQLQFHEFPRGKNKLDKGTDDQMVICREFRHKEKA